MTDKPDSALPPGVDPERVANGISAELIFPQTDHAEFLRQ